MSYQLSAAKRMWKFLLRTAEKSGKSQLLTILQKQQLITFFTFIFWHFLVDLGVFNIIVPSAAFIYHFSMMMKSTLQTVRRKFINNFY